MSLYLGVDIASVDENKPIDWKAATAAGCRFTFFRGSYARWADPTFQREAGRARDAGVTVGAYLFGLMRTTSAAPKDQVASFFDSAKLERGRDFVPVLDVEFSGDIAGTGRTRTELLAVVVNFIMELQDRFGVNPMIYTSARVWDGEDDDSLDADRLLGSDVAATITRCPLWLARYPYARNLAPVGDDASEKGTVEALPLPPVPKAWGPGNVWIHQYQGDAVRFPGFTRTADLNRFFDLREGALMPFTRRGEWVRSILRDATVREFQASSGLTADGVIGPRTFAALAWRNT